MSEETTLDLAAMGGRLRDWRRHLHRHPEVAGHEFETADFLHRHLEGLGLPVTAMAGTGLRAVLAGDPDGRTVALRADMDALPLTETAGREYGSVNPGAMHACGHDGHMAILLGVAELLARRPERLPGSVVFLFQPAEELPPGGATTLIEAGALDGVDAIFGLHLWQKLPTGTVGVVTGPMMAQSDNFRITVTGRGGHGSTPHLTADPILAAAQIVVSLQSVVSRGIDPLRPAVLSFGQVAGGTAYNIIPETVTLRGTVRTFDPAVQEFMARRLAEISAATAQALGAAAAVEYEPGYPPLVNDPAMAEFVRSVTVRTLGGDALRAIDPVMGGEDFAYYLQKIPGAFLFFGAGDGHPYPHHHPAFDIDEAALLPATRLLSAIAMEYLRRG